MSFEPMQDPETGAEVWPLEGGGAVVFDADGDAIEAIDAEGDAVDPSGIEYPGVEEDDGDEYFEEDDGELGELQARMGQLEELASQPRETVTYEPPAGPDDAQFTALADRAIGEIEAVRGRPLSDREANGLLEDVYADYTAGMPLDFAKSVQAAGIDRDFSKSEDRTAYMVERLGDAEREQAGEDYNPEPQPQRPEGYDLDVLEQRHQYLTDRVNGVDGVEALAYRSSSQPEYDPDTDDEEW